MAAVAAVAAAEAAEVVGTAVVEGEGCSNAGVLAAVRLAAASSWRNVRCSCSAAVHLAVCDSCAYLLFLVACLFLH